ncbi:unnamed protein product [Oppiella nova]|uniref:Uncharacterized protein n=1 Tax=Oppiella nova TaxID=334625 RepID=A0A7R9MUJ0_9ACAR|nr:unnamed protein product [Oppiella nova]CAG2183883.1 unnamed protein product [Oppiella nova]
MKWGTDKGGAMEELIQGATHGPLKQLASNMVYFDNRTNDLYRRVKDRELAFLASDSEVRYLITLDYNNTNTCEMMIAKEPVFTSSVSFVIRKGLPKGFRERLDYNRTNG